MANEKRLIDANQMALEESEAYIKVQTSGAISAITQGLNSVVHRKIQQLIADAPTVDAVEVVHGRWKYYHKQNKAVCTNCSFERDLDTNFGKAVSCPNCGAKMDGDKNG